MKLLNKLNFLFILILMISCTDQSGSNTFKSKFGYTIQLPNNWSEYEDETNTDAFFNTSKWSGNLRLTPVTIDPKKSTQYLKNKIESLDGKAKPFTTKSKFKGLKFSEESGEEYMYYWYVFAKDKMFICSFTIDSNQIDSKENQEALQVVDEIINSLKL
jgi:hypothetical protein